MKIITEKTQSSIIIIISKTEILVGITKRHPKGMILSMNFNRKLASIRVNNISKILENRLFFTENIYSTSAN